MADRNQNDRPSSAKSAPKEGKGNRPDQGRDDDLDQNTQPDDEKSSASRPRGHTEDADRTL